MKVQKKSTIDLVGKGLAICFLGVILIALIYGFSGADKTIKFNKVYSLFEKGDLIELVNDSNKTVDWLIVYENNFAKKYLKGEFLVKRRLAENIQVPTINYSEFSQLLRESNFSIRLIDPASVTLEEVNKLKLE